MKLTDTGVGDVEIQSTKKQRWESLDFDQQQAITDISESAKAMIELGYMRAAKHIKDTKMNDIELIVCWDQFGSCDRTALKLAWKK